MECTCQEKQYNILSDGRVCKKVMLQDQVELLRYCNAGRFQSPDVQHAQRLSDDWYKYVAGTEGQRREGVARKLQYDAKTNRIDVNPNYCHTCTTLSTLDACVCGVNKQNQILIVDGN